jgi:hypothetical protein
MFPTIGFLVHKILRIVESEIEMEMIFSLTRILINLRRFHLQLDNLEKFIFVNKNWFSDCKILVDLFLI